MDTLTEVMEEVCQAENSLIASIIARLERNEIEPVLKILRQWGKAPIKKLLETLNGEETSSGLRPS